MAQPMACGPTVELSFLLRSKWIQNLPQPCPGKYKSTCAHGQHTHMHIQNLVQHLLPSPMVHSALSLLAEEVEAVFYSSLNTH